MISDELISEGQLKKKQEKLMQQQKKFKNLQTDKKYFAEETIKLIKKQKLTIDKLKKENDTLKDLIGKFNTDKDAELKHGHTIEQMNDLLTGISSAIQEQKETQCNIDVHITNFQKKIVQKKKNCTSVSSGAENEQNLLKQIKILENRLDKANQKYNQTVSSNRNYKCVIDSLRKERVIFDNLYQKLEHQLQEKRKKMADIIEKANSAYEERDKANNQIQTLKHQSKKELTEFEKEIKQMSHLIEKLKLASSIKKVGLHYIGQENMKSQQQTVVEQKVTKQTKKSSEQMEKIQKFREDFAKIQAATQIHNFDQLLRIFSENQEKNFEMFKFVNLQSNQIEQLEFEIADLKKQLRQTEQGTVENQKLSYVIKMQNKLKQLDKNLKDTEESYKQCQKEAKILSGSIERIFQTIQCDRQVAKEIGGSKVLSETNLLIFLAIIGHKTTQIVSTFKQLSNTNILDHQPKHEAGQPSILTFQDFEDNEEYEKLLSADQLRKKAVDFIMKQQSQKQKKKEIRPRKK